MRALLSRLIHVGTRGLEPRQAQRVVLMNAIAVTLGLITLPYALIFGLMGVTTLAVAVVPIAFVYMSTPLVVARLSFTAARVVMFTMFPTAVTIYASSFGERSGIQLLYFAAVCMPVLLCDLSERRLLAYGLGRPHGRVPRLGALGVCPARRARRGSRSPGHHPLGDRADHVHHAAHRGLLLRDRQPSRRGAPRRAQPGHAPRARPRRSGPAHDRARWTGAARALRGGRALVRSDRGGRLARRRRRAPRPARRRVARARPRRAAGGALAGGAADRPAPAAIPRRRADDRGVLQADRGLRREAARGAHGHHRGGRACARRGAAARGRRAGDARPGRPGRAAGLSARGHLARRAARRGGLGRRRPRDARPRPAHPQGQRGALRHRVGGTALSPPRSGRRWPTSSATRSITASRGRGRARRRASPRKPRCV